MDLHKIANTSPLTQPKLQRRNRFYHGWGRRPYSFWRNQDIQILETICSCFSKSWLKCWPLLAFHFVPDVFSPSFPPLLHISHDIFAIIVFLCFSACIFISIRLIIIASECIQRYSSRPIQQKVGGASDIIIDQMDRVSASKYRLTWAVTHISV